MESIFFCAVVKIYILTANYFDAFWLNFVTLYANRVIFLPFTTDAGLLDPLRPLERIVCLKTLFKNACKAKQITSAFQNRLANTCKGYANK